MRLADFDFELPRELIADQPLEPREAARLLVLPSSGEMLDRPGHTASGEEIRDWLGRCTVAWRESDDPAALKGIVPELGHLASTVWCGP